MINLLINADDFGLNPTVNRAIVELLNTKRINSTTIMANMPGFDEAIQMAHKYNLTHQIGAHLTLTEGSPLTKELPGTDLFSVDNKLNHKEQIQKLIFISKNKEKFIFNELSAQIERIKKAGIPISHLDTHHHFHEAWAIQGILLALLKKYQIPYLRILNNLNTSSRFHKRIYRYMINSRLKFNKVHHSDFFGNQLDVEKSLLRNPDLFNNHKLEIMVHPDYNETGDLIDKIKGSEIGFKFPDVIENSIRMQWQLN
jgi:chitin disaccharide deacetylase